MPAHLTARDAYELWSATWDDDPSPIVALESRCMSAWLEDHCRGFIVDAGCGTGRWTQFLRERGVRVCGFDLSLAMLARARLRPGLAGSLAAADLTALPLAAGCADAVLCALVLGHVPDPPAAFTQLCRLVRPGGFLFLDDFHPDSYRRGWKRTFRHGGTTYEAQTYPYTVERLVHAARDEGLILEAVAEPCFGESERDIFVRAGKADLFDQVRQMPAVLLMRWRRPCT